MEENEQIDLIGTLTAEQKNELAHGGISFEDCGQETSVDELVTIFYEMRIFIKAVLNGISSYLFEKNYLHTSSTTAAAV